MPPAPTALAGPSTYDSAIDSSELDDESAAPVDQIQRFQAAEPWTLATSSNSSKPSRGEDSRPPSDSGTHTPSRPSAFIASKVRSVRRRSRSASSRSSATMGAIASARSSSVFVSDWVAMAMSLAPSGIAVGLRWGALRLAGARGRGSR